MERIATQAPGLLEKVSESLERAANETSDAIEELENLGWNYVHGAVIAPDGEQPERNTFGDVILRSRLQDAIARNNPNIPFEAQQEALKAVERIASPELMVNNQAFHKILTEGVPVEYRKDGVQRGDRVQLLDFSNPTQNDFLVVNQFTIIEGNTNKRPDVILFVNGLPLVVIELKNPADENADIWKAYDQLQTYKDNIPDLFTANVLWTVVYDTQYAMVDREDDLAVGIKSTAILFGDLDVRIIGLLQCLCLFAFWRCGVAFELGLFYDAAVIAVGALFGRHLWLIRKRDTRQCFIAFNQSKWIGLLILMGLCGHFWLGTTPTL